jgi:ABC-type methionine transport system ATPase subunit
MSTSPVFEHRYHPPVGQRIHEQIQLKIPPIYAQEPIIANLANDYELEVNIRSAFLTRNTQESGWFDLELYGTPSRIQQALAYLSQLHIQVWKSSSSKGYLGFS